MCYIIYSRTYVGIKQLQTCTDILTSHYLKFETTPLNFSAPVTATRNRISLSCSINVNMSSLSLVQITHLVNHQWFINFYNAHRMNHLCNRTRYKRNYLWSRPSCTKLYTLFAHVQLYIGFCATFNFLVACDLYGVSSIAIIWKQKKKIFRFYEGGQHSK